MITHSNSDYIGLVGIILLILTLILVNIHHLQLLTQICRSFPSGEPVI